jgi:hypothetical protein
LIEGGSLSGDLNLLPAELLLLLLPPAGTMPTSRLNNAEGGGVSGGCGSICCSARVFCCGCNNGWPLEL